jgi:FkbM family methyltransferase
MTTINYNPTLTKYLVKKKIFVNDNFVLLDIGSLGGIQDHYKCFEDQIKVIGFEPIKEEFDKLNLNKNKFNFFNSAVGKKTNNKKFYIRKNPSSSSFYEFEKDYSERFITAENFEVVKVIDLENIISLDQIAQKEIYNIDFIKIDAEGHEFEILNNANFFFLKNNIIGLHTEFHFNKKKIPNSPIFSELDLLIRNFGFTLFDISVGRESKNFLPSPMMHQYHQDGNLNKPIFGSTIYGQCEMGDALYFKDSYYNAEINLHKILKQICLYEIFYHFDSAAELVIKFKDKIDLLIDHKFLLDLLVPKIHRIGKNLSYNEYITRYKKFDPIFRPLVPGQNYIEEDYLYKTGYKPLTNNYSKILNHSRRNFFSRLINKIFFISISLIFKLLSNLKIINLELEIEVLIKRLRNY